MGAEKMFCYQCQETSKNTGCTVRGVCGKSDTVSNLQDLLIYTVKGIATFQQKGLEAGIKSERANRFILEGLFVTITNANFDDAKIITYIREGLEVRDELKKALEDKGVDLGQLHDVATFAVKTDEEIIAKSEAVEVGILATENEDVRSLRELITYGLKGMAAYAEHALNLGKEEEEINKIGRAHV